MAGNSFTLHLTWSSINSITVSESPWNFKGVFLGLGSNSVLSCRYQILFLAVEYPSKIRNSPFPVCIFIWSAHMNLCEPRFDDKIAISRGEAEWDCRQANTTLRSPERSVWPEIENYLNASEICSPHLTPWARFNVFMRQYISIVICSVTFTCLPQKKMSKFRSRDEEQFPPGKKQKLHQFSKEWKLW